MPPKRNVWRGREDGGFPRLPTRTNVRGRRSLFSTRAGRNHHLGGGKAPLSLSDASQCRRYIHTHTSPIRFGVRRVIFPNASRTPGILLPLHVAVSYRNAVSTTDLVSSSPQNMAGPKSRTTTTTKSRQFPGIDARRERCGKNRGIKTTYISCGGGGGASPKNRASP